MKPELKKKPEPESKPEVTPTLETETETAPAKEQKIAAKPTSVPVLDADDTAATAAKPAKTTGSIPIEEWVWEDDDDWDDEIEVKMDGEEDDEDEDDGEPVQDEKSSRQASDASNSNTILMIGSTHLGKGNKKQGRTLMRGFLYTLSQITKLPHTIILLNSGVKLALRSSHCLDDLIDLEARGTEILICGSSLEAYDGKGKLAVGKVVTMYHITGLLMSGNPIVTL